MQFFYWIVLLIMVGIAIFAIQNSNAPLVTIKFFFWKWETSLVYTILASIGLGVFVTLLFWIPRAIRSSLHRKGTTEEPSHTSHEPLEKRRPL